MDKDLKARFKLGTLPHERELVLTYLATSELMSTLIIRDIKRKNLVNELNELDCQFEALCFLYDNSNYAMFLIEGRFPHITWY